MKYFAYGSNLLTRRLTDPSRAPSAVALGIASARGFVVRFHKIGTDGSGKCTLIATGDDADVVYGVLYEFADSDLAGLDREEGVHLGAYHRHCIRVGVLDGSTTEAVTYVASDRYVDAACVPFDWYRDLCVAGAMEHALPLPYVKELARTPAAPDPDAARAARARRLLAGSGPGREGGVERAAAGTASRTSVP